MARPDTDSENPKPATSFSAETHVRFFEDIMHIYGVNVHEYSLCQVADNCNTNTLIASLLEIPHVGCASYRLHLEVRRMIARDSRLSKTIDSVHKTMKCCKQRMKNRALLRNICDLNPIVADETWWSSIYHTIDRFTKLRDSLITVSESSQSDLVIDQRQLFKFLAERIAKMLSEINVVTVEL